MVTLGYVRTLALMLSLVIPFRDAAAHPRLVRANPVAGASVAAPRFIALTFSEPLTAALCRVTLLDAGMKPVALDTVKSMPGDPKTLSVGIRGPLAAGHYTVKWQVAGDDGHPVRGQYTFEVEAGATGAAEHTRGAAALLAGVTFTLPLPQVVEALRSVLAPVVVATAVAPTRQDDDESVFGVESPAYVVLRAMQAAAVIALLGVLAVHFLVGPRFARIATPDGLAMLAAAEHAAVRWVTPLLAVLLAATGGRLLAQHAAVFGTHEMPTLASLSDLLLASLWGRGWLLAFCAAIVGLVAARRLRNTESAGWKALAVVALVVSFSMAMSGHAAADSAFAMTLQALHVVGAGGWIGSLAIVVLVAVPAALRTGDPNRHAFVAALIRAFSPAALAFAGLVAVTGVLAAWRNVESASALWQARYGQILLVKLAFLSIAAVTGFFNWRYVLPVLGTGDATTRLRTSGAVELVAALGVLIVTAILVATPMPSEMFDQVAP